MSSSALSNSFSASFICHSCNCNSESALWAQLSTIAASPTRCGSNSIACFQPLSPKKLPHNSFPWHLPLHPLLLLGSTCVSVNCSCAPCVEISGEILRCSCWWQRRGDFNCFSLVWVLPGESQTLSYYKNGLYPLLLNVHITILNFSFIGWTFLGRSWSHPQNLSAFTELFLCLVL